MEDYFLNRLLQATLNTEQTPKIFLQNKLAKAQAKLNEAKGIAQSKGK
jgi:hypothetical protein